MNKNKILGILLLSIVGIIVSVVSIGSLYENLHNLLYAIIWYIGLLLISAILIALIYIGIKLLLK